MQEIKYIIEKHGELIKKVNTKSLYLMDMLEDKEDLTIINNKEKNSKKENNNVSLG